MTTTDRICIAIFFWLVLLMQTYTLDKLEAADKLTITKTVESCNVK